MMIEFEPGELETKFFSPEGAERLNELVITRASVGAFIEETEARFQREKLLANIYDMATFVEPLDRSVDILDATLPAANTFYNGARVALGGLMLFSNREQRKTLETMKFLIPESALEQDEDRYQLMHEIGVTIIEAGLRGFDFALAYHDFYADIEREVSEQVKYDTFGQAGFGIPFYLVHAAIEAPKLARLKQAHEEEMAQLEALKNTVNRLDEGEVTIDWDASFAKLIGDA